ncbi:MAG TPA: four helix bundle protein [Candidatus Solibacter sp.]|nr:four helix bundle protein [Candidatus Solibacter sp.]
MGTLDKADAMKLRTKQFALRVFRVVRSLPKSREGDVLARQLLRSGTVVAANYRAVCRSRSHAEFVSKMNVVVEEADETVFWLEMLTETGMVRSNKLELLIKEGNEVLAICAASLRTARHNKGA